MAQRSPTLAGFRAVFRQPSLALAEITWRWSFGTAAGVLLALSLFEYLDTLTVTGGDLLFLRSGQPFLISQALAHIFHGSAPRLVKATLLLLPALALLWMVAAALGRTATLKALLGYFGQGEDLARPCGLRSLAGLNFLRVALALATVVGCVGAMILAGFASSKTDPAPGLVFLIFLPLALLVGLLWSVVNWFLSLASVFVVRDGQDTFGALAAAVSLCRERAGPVFAAGTWFGLAHLVAFVVATSVVAFPMAFARVLPAGIVLGGVLLVTLLYFAVVDFLYVGRLAAYVCIVQDSYQPSAAGPQLAEGTRHSALSPEQEDLILSDLQAAKDPAAAGGAG